MHGKDGKDLFNNKLISQQVEANQISMPALMNIQHEMTYDSE